MLTEARAAPEMRCPAAAGQQYVQPAVACRFLSSSPASNLCRYASAPGALADTFIRLIRPRSPDRDINPHDDDSLPAQASRHPTRPSAVQYSRLPRSVLLLQFRAQRGYGPRGVTLHRAAADAHRRRYLGFGEVRVVPQHDRLTLPGG